MCFLFIYFRLLDVSLDNKEDSDLNVSLLILCTSPDHIR
jgi:hypothetical protein